MEAGNLNRTGGLTIAEQHAAVGVYLEEADDDRSNGAARLAGLLNDPEQGVEQRFQFMAWSFAQRFHDVPVEIVGCAARFSGRITSPDPSSTQ